MKELQSKHDAATRIASSVLCRAAVQATNETLSPARIMADMADPGWMG